jgi:hypothetical protein
MERTDMAVTLGFIALLITLSLTTRSCQIHSDSVRERTVTTCLKANNSPLECGAMFK